MAIKARLKILACFWYRQNTWINLEGTGEALGIPVPLSTGSQGDECASASCSRNIEQVLPAPCFPRAGLSGLHIQHRTRSQGVCVPVPCTSLFFPHVFLLPSCCACATESPGGWHVALCWHYSVAVVADGNGRGRKGEEILVLSAAQIIKF